MSDKEIDFKNKNAMLKVAEIFYEVLVDGIEKGMLNEKDFFISEEKGSEVIIKGLSKKQKAMCHGEIYEEKDLEGENDVHYYQEKDHIIGTRKKRPDLLDIALGTIPKEVSNPSKQKGVVEGTIIKETDKAYLVQRYDDKVAWIAKSVLEKVHELDGGNDCIIEYQNDKAWMIDKLEWKEDNWRD